MFQAEAVSAPSPTRATAPLRIGIDFDNTLIDYDRVFLKTAQERGLVAADFAGSKREVRDAIRRLPDGELAWQRLQGHVYGAGIGGAVLFEGADAFLRQCRALNVDVFIVSHKTRYGHLDPARVDLRQAALGWMAAHGFFNADGFGFRQEDVFFEETRPAKLARIAALNCTHFIDDLEEVFADPAFPASVRGILFATASSGCPALVCCHWRDVTMAVLGNAVDRYGETAAVAGALLGVPIDAVEPVRSTGRNSRVFRVRSHGDSFALKNYPPDQGRGRDRMGAEAGALGLLNRHDIPAVPRLLGSDAARGYILMEWIEGESVDNPTAADMEAAMSFLSAVHALRLVDEAAVQPLAAEACLSGTEIVTQVERRIARLSDLAPAEPALIRFLDSEVKPLLEAVNEWAEAGYRARGLAFGRPIDDSARTLCPSDFGFHNALRTPAGRLVFIDFDYFGWDDPVKLVSDFLLHPGMSLPVSMKRRFAGRMTEVYGNDASFAARLSLLFPLFALRWCMIMLNEFLPERWLDRVHAGAHSDWETAKRRQLDRVSEWVQSLRSNFRWFPYGK